MALDLEKIQPWDGQSGTGSEARGVIDRNFEKINSELEKKLEPDDLADYAKTGGSEKTVKEVEGEIAQLAGATNEKVASLGMDIYGPGTNFLAELAASSLDDEEVWGMGYFNGDGRITHNVNRKYTKKYYRIPAGQCFVYLFLSGSMKALVYDKNFNIIAVIGERKNSEGLVVFESAETFPEGAFYFRTSHDISKNVSSLKITSDENVSLVTNKTYAFSNEVVTLDEKIEETKELTGITTYPSGTNFLAELAASSLDDEEVWGVGFLNSSGGVSAGADWRYTKKTYRVYPGQINVNLIVSGNAKALVYNSKNEIVYTIGERKNSEGLVVFESAETFPEGTVYMRLSHPYNYNVSGIRVNNMQDVMLPSNDVFAYNTELLKTKELTGITTYPSGTNFLAELAASSLDDEEVWGVGYYNLNGGIGSGANWRYTKKTYRVYSGVHDVVIALFGNAKALVYNSKNEIVYTIGERKNSSGGVIFNSTETFPEGSAYMRLSHETTEDTSIISVVNITNIVAPTNNVFAFSGDVPLRIKSEMAKTGVKNYSAGSNLFSELASSSLDDEEVWGMGFLNSSGGVSVVGSDWRYTKKYYRITKGAFDVNLFVSGNARALIYNIDREIVYMIGDRKDGSGKLTYASKETFPEGAFYFRTSHVISKDVNAISVSSEDDTTIPTDEVYAYAGEARGLLNIVKKIRPARRTPAIITFISDDGNIKNDWFLDALEPFGYKATFALITAALNGSIPSQFARQDVISLLIEKGHEVAGHTVTHSVDIPLTSRSEDELHYEIGKCKFDLLALDNRVEVSSFVSPQGYRNATVDRIVRQYFNANYVTRSDSTVGTPDSINYPPIDHFNLKRVSFDELAGNGALHISRIGIAKQAVDYVKANGGWLVFTIHPQYAQYNNAANTVDSKQELRDTLAYIHGLDIPILTAAQALKHYENLSIGNLRLDNEYTEIGCDGTVIGDLIQ